MLRWTLRIPFLALSAMLLVWVYEGLFGVDQSAPLLPFLAGSDGGYGAAIFGGVVWGLLLMTPGADLVRRRGPTTFETTKASPRRRARMTEIAVATITESNPTGATVNDVPLYEVFMNVTEAGGSSFTAAIRVLLHAKEIRAMRSGEHVAVRYAPGDHDLVVLADAADPAVRAELLRWRIDRGLVPREQLGARTRGVAAPAAVVALRPTGGRKEGQVEVEMTLLVMPEGGGDSWEAETRAFLYPQALSHVQVGSPVYALYEPINPTIVALSIEDPRTYGEGR